MTGQPSLLERASGHLTFILDNADMIYPLLLSVPVLVAMLA